MAIKVYLNNVLVPHKDGIPISFANNEQLDSGVLVVPNVTTKLTIKRNDEIRLKNGNNNKYYLVAGFKYSLASMKSPYIYTYEITLVSYTMKLQSYLLPNLTITQPLNYKYTIYEQANRIRYILKLQSTYTFSTFFISMTSGITCPEFSFNRRNFWEILNTLLEVVDCVVTMDSPTKIGCRKLKNATEQIDSSKIIDLRYGADANDFCSELEMNAENVVGDNVTSNSEYWVTPRTTSYILNTNNAQLILEKPIYYLNKVMLKFKTVGGISIEWIGRDDPTQEGTDAIGTGAEFIFDITKWVVEDTVYNTKLPSNIPSYDDTAFDKKRYFLSFKEGAEIIDNLSYDEKEWIPFFTSDIAIWNIMIWEIINKWKDEHPTKVFFGENHLNALPDVRELLFNVDYVSLNTIRFRTRKQTDELMNEKVIASNQTSSYVDANALGKSEQANANRIGNEYYELTLKDFIPDTSKYYFYRENGVNYYLTKYQIRYTDIGSTYLTGIFTKNFIQKDLFTGINSRARYTSIATGSDVLLRQDIVNLKFSIDSQQTSEFDFVNLFSSLWSHLGQRKKYEILATTDETEDFFKLPIASYLLGNNHIILEFRFKNNASVGMMVDDEQTGSGTTKYICKDVRYVNNDGEFGDFDFTIQEINENDTNQTLQAKKYPIAYKNGNKIISFGVSDTVINIDARKDNREIYGVCVNIEIASNNEHVILTDYFFENLPLVCNKQSELYLYLGEEIDETEQIYLDQDTNTYISVEGQYIQTYIQSFCNDRSVDFDGLKEWGICDGNNRKLIKVTDKSINKLYFNKE